MISKPVFLKGIAEEFNYLTPEKCSHLVRDWADECDFYSELRECYNQDASPTTIASLFKNVEIRYWLTRTYYSPNYPEPDRDGDTQWRGPVGKWLTEEEKDKAMEKYKEMEPEIDLIGIMINGSWTFYDSHKSFNPKTISQFITFCNLYNVKLEWKD